MKYRVSDRTCDKSGESESERKKYVDTPCQPIKRKNIRFDVPRFILPIGQE